MLIGYARVSTKDQDLENQLEALAAAGCEKVIHGKQSGASRENEAKLAELVGYVREGDVVVVSKLDRLGRSLKAISRPLRTYTTRARGCALWMVQWTTTLVLNAEARAVVEAQRGEYPERVFTYNGKSLESMDNSAWRRVRKSLGMEHVRVHDLRHTFGRRLRVEGVALEARQELMGHASGSITTHYSVAEVWDC
ncbi:MAG: hypothetical protein CL583_15260 [Alteromonadaceae bacterium]|nr:hypothetical protein [Alteromonadaceae bacterium]|tara:strand:- start:510 stop:1094 length:585 start_codon:yes stop_codon:yes gene_type:complete